MRRKTLSKGKLVKYNGDIFYCRNTDAKGYCCTSRVTFGKEVCDPHSIYPSVLRESSYMKLPELSGSITAPEAEIALRNAINVSTLSAVPHFYVSAFSSFPPPPLRKIKDMLFDSAFFKQISDHYDTVDWVGIVNGAGNVAGNKYLKKLAAYVAPLMNTDSRDATALTADGLNIKILASAGIDFRDITSEIAARQNLWNQMPYMRLLLHQKYASGTTEYNKTKRELIDALTEVGKIDPKPPEKSFQSFFSGFRTSNQDKPVAVLMNMSLMAMAPELSASDTVANILRGFIGRKMGLQDPDLNNPAIAVAAVVSNFEKIYTDFECKDTAGSAIASACWDWTVGQSRAVSKQNTIEEYAKIAQGLMPAFVDIR